MTFERRQGAQKMVLDRVGGRGRIAAHDGVQNDTVLLDRLRDAPWNVPENASRKQIPALLDQVDEDGIFCGRVENLAEFAVAHGWRFPCRPCVSRRSSVAGAIASGRLPDRKSSPCPIAPPPSRAGRERDRCFSIGRDRVRRRARCGDSPERESRVPKAPERLRGLASNRRPNPSPAETAAAADRAHSARAGWHFAASSSATSRLVRKIGFCGRSAMLLPPSLYFAKYKSNVNRVPFPARDADLELVDVIGAHVESGRPTRNEIGDGPARHGAECQAEMTVAERVVDVRMTR